jgi:hypothetical protein
MPRLRCSPASLYPKGSGAYYLKEDMKEVWKDVIGYEGYYSISNKGRVRRDKQSSGTQAGRILSNKHFDGSGYFFIILSKNQIHKTTRVHILVARHFIGKRPKGYEINHKDGIKNNNCINNLEYVTSSGNKLHALKFGLMKPSSHPFTKLTKEKALAIRREYVPFKNPARVLAKKYGVCDSVIAEIVSGLAWKEI